MKLGIKISPRPLDCDPFFHDYGIARSEAELLIAMWGMPVTDMYGTEIKIPFYLTKGNSFWLFGNEILHKSRLLGPENAFVYSSRGAPVVGQVSSAAKIQRTNISRGP